MKVTAHALDNPPDYMAVDLTMPSNCVWYANAEVVPFGVTNDLYKTEKLLMRRIHAAGVRWRKGSTQGQETGHWGTEPAYPVILTKDYYMGVFQVTCRQFVLFSTPNSTDMSNATLPKQNVNSNILRGAVPTYDWYSKGLEVDPSLPLYKLRKFTGVETFDLPSDAQWEFACLGGTAHPRFGVLTSDLAKYAWYGKIKTSAQPVGLLLPNPYGLYDMLGNGSELCNDWYGEGSDYAVEGVLQIDPRGPASNASNAHVVHAASYDHGSDYQRACARSSGLTIGQTTSTPYATCRLICGIDMK